jgi:HlyD family secretion protein
MKTNRPNRVWIYVAFALTAIVVVVVLSERQPVPDVPVQTAIRASLSAAVTTNGKIEPIAPHEMRSLVGSHVTKVYAKEGQHVKKGELLAELDDAQIQADRSLARETLVTNQERLDIARAGGKVTELAQLESDLKKTDVERDRLSKNVVTLEALVAKQAATPQELNLERANLARAESDKQRLETTRTDFLRNNKVDVDRLSLLVQQSQDNLRDIEQKLASTRVIAPVEGTLYSLPVHVNDSIKEGDLLAAVADLRQIRVRAFVDEPELGVLEMGQTVVVSWDALPNRTWTGKTDQIPRQVVQHLTRSVGELLCPLNNDDQRLIPNITVSVRIQLRSRNNVVTAPRGAVVFEGSKRFVYVADSDQPGTRIHKREIKIGIADSTTYEVESGLNEGEIIALPSNLELRDGMKVNPTKPE